MEYKGKVLVEKRKQSESTVPGSIIFPAGHIEKGETKEQALYREMLQELGIKIYVPKLIYHANFDCEEKQRIFWYTCGFYKGKIINNEAEELLWINHSESNLLTHHVSRDALSAYLRSKK